MDIDFFFFSVTYKRFDFECDFYSTFSINDYSGTYK